jgi:hypothetical protein
MTYPLRVNEVNVRGGQGRRMPELDLPNPTIIHGRHRVVSKNDYSNIEQRT